MALDFSSPGDESKYVQGTELTRKVLFVGRTGTKARREKFMNSHGTKRHMMFIDTHINSREEIYCHPTSLSI